MLKKSFEERIYSTLISLGNPNKNNIASALSGLRDICDRYVSEVTEQSFKTRRNRRSLQILLSKNVKPRDAKSICAAPSDRIDIHCFSLQ